MAEPLPPQPLQDHEKYLSEPDDVCKDYIMQQTMMRIKDPKVSLDFYSRVLGMRCVGLAVQSLKLIRNSI